MELLMSRVPENETAPETIAIETLVRRTLAGDCQAFEQIVLLYERRVMTLSRRLLQGNGRSPGRNSGSLSQSLQVPPSS